MKNLGAPRRRARELRGALEGAGISLDEISTTNGNHLRMVVSRNGVTAIHHASNTPGETRRDLMNTIRDAKRALRAKGAEI